MYRLRKKLKGSIPSQIFFYSYYKNIVDNKKKTVKDTLELYTESKKKDTSNQKSKRTFSENLNLAGLIVNFFLLLGTLIALCFTYISLNISIDSLEFAKKLSQDSDSASKSNFILTRKSVEAAEKLSKLADSNYYVTKLGIENSNSNYKKSYEISKKSFEETIAQFNKVNTPYIQAQDFELEEIKTGSPITIHFNLVNVTNIPVKIIKQSCLTKIDKSPFSLNESHLYYDSKAYNQYLIKDIPLAIKSSEIGELTKVTEPFFATKNDVYIFMLKDVIYQNLITGAKRHYKFQVKMKKYLSSTAYKNTYSEFIYNENLNY